MGTFTSVRRRRESDPAEKYNGWSGRGRTVVACGRVTVTTTAEMARHLALACEGIKSEGRVCLGWFNTLTSCREYAPLLWEAVAAAGIDPDEVKACAYGSLTWPASDPASRPAPQSTYPSKEAAIAAYRAWAASQAD